MNGHDFEFEEFQIPETISLYFSEVADSGSIVEGTVAFG